MANNKPTPPGLQELIDNTKLREIYLKWPVLNRCERAYDNITFDGWPVERTCAVYDISSTWYRLQAMRHSTEWEQEHLDEIEYEKKEEEWQNKLFPGLALKRDTFTQWAVEMLDLMFRKILLKSSLSEKIIRTYSEEYEMDLHDYSKITIEDIQSLKDVFFVEWNEFIVNNNNNKTAIYK